MIKVPLSRPDITPSDKRKIVEVLNTPFLSRGPLVEEFEKRIAQYTGVKYAVAVNSGTGALHLIVKSLGLKAGDEVVTTPFSFIASANCLLYEHVRPVFADIEPETLNIDPAKIEKAVTAKTKAILAVDVFGHPADWDALRKIARKHGLPLIEDSCEALGSEYKGRKAGSFGAAAAFAFYPNKQITTAEGGMVVTDNKKIADLCRSLRNQGRAPNQGRGHGVFPRLGYSYRLSEIHSALGLAQLERIAEILRKRAAVAELYYQGLRQIGEVEPPPVAAGVKMGWFVYVIRLQKKYRRCQRDKLLLLMQKKGIECGIYFESIHLQPLYRRMFNYRKGDYPVAEAMAGRVLALPFFNGLTRDQITAVVRTLKAAIHRIHRSKT